MMEIVYYNVVFWSVWIGLSYLPQYITQKVIDKHTQKV